ncbi:MAG: phosphonate C-P lyase system protein PhnH [Burkholderiaceae bacterium]
MSLPDLASLARGFAQPEPDSQRAFRALLDAMANPGRRHTITPPGFVGPADLPTSMACLLQCLADPQTSVWLSPRWRQAEAITGFVRFHCGCPFAGQPGDAELALMPATELDGQSLARLNAGTDLLPHIGTTLIIACSSLTAGTRLRLRGPGIADQVTIGVTGPPVTFWTTRLQMQDDFPRGIDLVLCADDQVLALPRTTRLEID